MIYGNIDGVRDSVLNVLEDIYEIRQCKDSIFTEELVEVLRNITLKLQREVSVAINRKGKVVSVGIGDSSTVELPLIDIKENRLSGVRVIHTHPNGNPKLSALDLSALIKLKLDCIVAIGVKEDVPCKVNVGYCAIENNILIHEEVYNLSVEQAKKLDFLDKIAHIEELIKHNEIEEEQGERAILVGIESEDSLDELEELAYACNVETIEKVFQKKNKEDKAFCVGSGKVDEIGMLLQALKANVVIFDEELSGAQVRNLEDSLGVKVIDRTTLILEIFARRAKSREAKLQVELAQLKYRSARLIGLGTILSRTGGGIGTRGPGEKKLEIDKRRIRERVTELSRELQKIKSIRIVQREKRVKGNIPKLSLVGYTNTGKSTLRNRLCKIVPSKNNNINKENVFEADMLFATVDTTTRAISLPDGRVATLADTVGFIRKLPHDLVESFKSTLEEVVNSDLLIHVVDSSSEKLYEQVEAVEAVLTELGVNLLDCILVLNKIDKVSEEQLKDIEQNLSRYKLISISAREEKNIDELLELICDNLPQTIFEKEFLIPYTEQKLVSYIHRNGKVLEESYEEEGTKIKALIDDEIYNKCISFELK